MFWEAGYKMLDAGDAIFYSPSYILILIRVHRWLKSLCLDTLSDAACYQSVLSPVLFCLWYVRRAAFAVRLFHLRYLSG